MHAMKMLTNELVNHVPNMYTNSASVCQRGAGDTAEQSAQSIVAVRWCDNADSANPRTTSCSAHAWASYLEEEMKEGRQRKRQALGKVLGFAEH